MLDASPSGEKRLTRRRQSIHFTDDSIGTRPPNLPSLEVDFNGFLHKLACRPSLQAALLVSYCFGISYFEEGNASMTPRGQRYSC